MAANTGAVDVTAFRVEVIVAPVSLDRPFDGELGRGAIVVIEDEDDCQGGGGLKVELLQ